jgi:orotate phosphoribosyltransferase
VQDGDLVQLARDVDARCRLCGQFTLRSGTLANEYFDKYLFESDPVLLRRVADHMTALVPAGGDLLGGLELGGVPLATMLSSLAGIPALFVRKEAKTYGTRRLAEGSDPAGRTVLLVEDVTRPAVPSATQHKPFAPAAQLSRQWSVRSTDLPRGGVPDVAV